jgi:hypothetical protein
MCSEEEARITQKLYINDRRAWFAEEKEMPGYTNCFCASKVKKNPGGRCG